MSSTSALSLTPSASCSTSASVMPPALHSVTSRTFARVSADSASENRMVSSSDQPPRSTPRAKYLRRGSRGEVGVWVWGVTQSLEPRAKHASSDTHCVCTASVSEKKYVHATAFSVPT